MVSSMLAHLLILLDKLVFESLRGKSHRRSSLKICEVLRLPENMKLILIIATLVVIASITMAKPRSKFIGGLSVKEIGKMTKEIDMDEYHEQVEHLVELTRYSVRMRIYLMSQGHISMLAKFCMKE